MQQGYQKEEREKGTEAIFKIVMTEFLQINVRHQNSENAKPD